MSHSKASNLGKEHASSVSTSATQSYLTGMANTYHASGGLSKATNKGMSEHGN